MGLVGGCLTTGTKDGISQLIANIRNYSNLLLKQRHYREASGILRLTGYACRRVGERHCGLERQEYILQV